MALTCVDWRSFGKAAGIGARQLARLWYVGFACFVAGTALNFYNDHGDHGRMSTFSGIGALVLLFSALAIYATVYLLRRRRRRS
jgi:hypothetical protein